jgi:hypothetical protein
MSMHLVAMVEVVLLQMQVHTCGVVLPFVCWDVFPFSVATHSLNLFVLLDVV